LGAFAAGGITDYFIVFRKLGWGTHHLSYIEFGRLKLEVQFVKGHPRFRIHLRIVNRYGEFQGIVIEAVKFFLYAQVGAMRAAGAIDSGSLIRSRGLHHKRVVILPLSDRVAEPPWFGFFG